MEVQVSHLLQENEKLQAHAKESQKRILEMMEKHNKEREQLNCRKRELEEEVNRLDGKLQVANRERSDAEKKAQQVEFENEDLQKNLQRRR